MDRNVEKCFINEIRGRCQWGQFFWESRSFPFNSIWKFSPGRDEQADSTSYSTPQNICFRSSDKKIKCLVVASSYKPFSRSPAHQLEETNSSAVQWKSCSGHGLKHLTWLAWGGQVHTGQSLTFDAGGGGDIIKHFTTLASINLP